MVPTRAWCRPPTRPTAPGTTSGSPTCRWNWTPHHPLTFLRKHRDLADLYGEAPAAVKTAIEGFGKLLGFAEQRLLGHYYLVGEHFTGADLMLVSCLIWAHADAVDVTEVLAQYRDRLTGREAFRKANELNSSNPAT